MSEEEVVFTDELVLLGLVEKVGDGFGLTDKGKAAFYTMAILVQPAYLRELADGVEEFKGG